MRKYGNMKYPISTSPPNGIVWRSFLFYLHRNVTGMILFNLNFGATKTEPRRPSVDVNKNKKKIVKASEATMNERQNLVFYF